MEVATHRGHGPLQQVIEIGPHRLLTDVAPELGGAAYALHRSIRYVGALSEEEKQRLTDIANKCPVCKTLSGKIEITTEAH